MKPYPVLFIVATFVLLGCISTEAQVYRHEDEYGVHYTNAPVGPHSRLIVPGPGYVEVPRVQYDGSSAEGARSFKAKKTKSGKKPVTKQAMASGTAWPISHGYAVTNFHVVEGRGAIFLILPDGTKLSAKIAAGDKSIDLALLKVSDDDRAKLPQSIPLADSGAKLGTKVFTIGYPLTKVIGEKPKLTDGVVSGEFGLKDDARTCQITTPIQPGSSGSPLMTMNGEVVGIVVAKLNSLAALLLIGDVPQNVNFAIKVSYLKALLDSVPESDQEPLKELPREEATLEQLAQRVEGSILRVVAQ